MKRTSPSTSLVTLVGMIATIAGILVCLFFLFTPVSFGAVELNTRTDGSPDLQIAMRWIQPILGQAIVEDALLRHRSNDADVVSTIFGAQKPASASAQWVMGRIIVELNRSRLIGGLSDEQRIMKIAQYATEALL
jgi:hypothetical protein